MRTLTETKSRWLKTILPASDVPELKRRIKKNSDDNPCKAGLRSICWKVFLLFHSTDTQIWHKDLEDSRSAYSSLREHFLKSIEHPEQLGASLDPLDDDLSSPWNALRQDEEMRAEILQDVNRCMPEDPFFREPRPQRMLLDILFVFCKLNQDVGYRQGMHELLAPILRVVEEDSVDTTTKSGIISELAFGRVEEALDYKFVEHDAFTLFSLLMQSAKPFYEIGEGDGRNRSSTNLTASSGLNSGSSPIVERSKQIHEVLLAQVDPELSDHLSKIEILPQIFLIRWIRLLFGREFPFDGLLILWDTLFAEDPSLELVDMICVAMILRIRWQLIEASYSIALMLLLKYSSPEGEHGPQQFVEDASYLRDNFSIEGGDTIIRKYSGKLPQRSSHTRSTSRTSSPMGVATKPHQQLSRTKSPLASPARFLQQQRGVEALFQGAAKGVLERGERLGINQAVRDAVGEVRKNMQGMQTPRHSPHYRRPSDTLRWSLDEGRNVASVKKSLADTEVRNKQLARMLEAAMVDVRALSTTEEEKKDSLSEAVDSVHAKLQLIREYLDDSTLFLRIEATDETTEAAAKQTDSTPSNALDTAAVDSEALPSEVKAQEATDEPDEPPKSVAAREAPSLTISRADTTSLCGEATSQTIGEEHKPPERPRGPMPTRSKLAQSSFSWMLEPDETSTSALRSTPPKPSSSSSSSPFSAKQGGGGGGKRPGGSGVNRDNAFLFGDDDDNNDNGGGGGDEAGEIGPRHRQKSLQTDSQEVFGMGAMRNPGAQPG